MEMDGRLMTSKDNMGIAQHEGQLLSLQESMVANALMAIRDDDISVTIHPNWIVVEEQSTPFQYGPDFLVRRNSTGQELFVEVKSIHSLSLANLAMFRAVAKQLKKTGKDFLVLVLDNSSKREIRSTSFNTDEVQILTVSDLSQIPDTVFNALPAAP